MISYCLNLQGSTNTKKRKQPKLLSKLQMQLILIQLLRPILKTFKNVLTFLFYQQKKQTTMKKIQVRQLLLKFQLKQYITLYYRSFLPAFLIFFLFYQRLTSMRIQKRKSLQMQTLLQDHIKLIQLIYPFPLCIILQIGIEIIIIKKNKITSIANAIKNVCLYKTFSGLSKYLYIIFPKNVKTAKNTIPTALRISFSSFNLSSLISIKLLYQGTE